MPAPDERLPTRPERPLAAAEGASQPPIRIRWFPAGSGESRTDGPPRTGCTITACTAIHNRAGLVHRVYESLLRQTFTDFEWIVVDDASTEDVESVIAAFAGTKPFFSITYIRKRENTGHTHTRGVALAHARGAFVVNCDSDDTFRPEAFETFLDYWNDIPERVRPCFREVVAHCEDEYGAFVGTRLPAGTEVLDVDSFEAMYRYRIVGENGRCSGRISSDRSRTSEACRRA